VDGFVCAAAHVAVHAVRDGPGSLPDGLLVYRFGGWFEAGPASYSTARVQRFSGVYSIRDGPGVLPDGSLAVLRRMVGGGPGVLPDSSLTALRPMVRSRRARCLARRLARGASADGSRRARRLARRLACGALADGSTHARRRSQRLAYIVSIGDGPGCLHDGSLVYRLGAMVGSSDASANGRIVSRFGK